MVRGKNVPDGSERVAQNGYHYVKVKGVWRLKHHLIAESILARPLDPDERVSFKDNDRANFDPDNIVVSEKGRGSLRRRLAQLEARRDEINAQIASIKQELAKV